MDVREKLVELLREAPYNIFGNKLGNCYFDSCLELIAHHLIANGVTVQEWISVKDRLPENNQWALCFMKDKSFGTFRVFQWNYIDWQWNDGNERWKEKDVTHWMPLPEIPKGE